MRIGVVGAGIAGLTCAFQLQRAGHEVRVYEREARAGGRMCTIEAGGFAIDVGANLLLENFDRTRALVFDLKLGDQWMELCARGSGGVLRDDELEVFSPRHAFDVLRFRGLSWPTRIRLFSFLWGARRWVDGLDFFDLSLGDDALEAVDADTFLRARYGDELVDWLADPFVRTFHFHGADRISMKYFDALAGLLVGRGGFVPHVLRGHMRALPEALASRVPVVLSTPVRAIERDGASVRVVLDGQVERFDSVVLAAPGSSARQMLGEGFDAQRRLLDAIEYSATLMCAFRVPLTIAREFEGIWVPFAESRVVCCCANETCKGSCDERDCVFVLGVHDESARSLLPQPDEKVFRAVTDEWERLFPEYGGALQGLFVQRWPEALPVYAPGTVRRVSRFWVEGQGEGNVWLCGDYLNHPWIEGSIRCAEKVAARIGSRGV